MFQYLKPEIHCIPTYTIADMSWKLQNPSTGTLLDLPLLCVLDTFIFVHSQKSYSLQSPRLISSWPGIWQLYCPRMQALFCLPSIIWHMHKVQHITDDEWSERRGSWQPNISLHHTLIFHKTKLVIYCVLQLKTCRHYTAWTAFLYLHYGLKFLQINIKDISILTNMIKNKDTRPKVYIPVLKLTILEMSTNEIKLIKCVYVSHISF
jgi:hypothetical protein